MDVNVNIEAIIVLIAAIMGSFATFIVSTQILGDYSDGIGVLLTTMAAAVLAFWRFKVNTPADTTPVSQT